VTKEDELIEKTGLKLRQRIIIITQDDVIHIAMESEEDVKMWLDVLKKLLKAKYSREELSHKEDAKKVCIFLLLHQPAPVFFFTVVRKNQIFSNLLLLRAVSTWFRHFSCRKFFVPWRRFHERWRMTLLHSYRCVGAHPIIPKLMWRGCGCF
jgi:hypothetical protein